MESMAFGVFTNVENCYDEVSLKLLDPDALSQAPSSPLRRPSRPVGAPLREFPTFSLHPLFSLHRRSRFGSSQLLPSHNGQSLVA